MDSTNLGTSGLKVSRVALGGMSFGTPREVMPWTLGADAAQPIFRQALDLGVVKAGRLAAGRLTRPWGEQGSARSQANPSVDTFGRPLWLDGDKAIVDVVARIAREHGVSMATVAMAWVLKHPVVDAPIVGATKPHHLIDAVAALDLQLADDEIGALEEHYTPRLPTYFN